MDEAVIKYYRQLLKTNFENSGSLDNPSILIEAVGENMIHCGNTGNYMQLYVNVSGNRIDAIRYLCACEPSANVAVEILCNLVKGRTLEEALTIPEEAFYQFLGSSDEELQLKVGGLREMLQEGIRNYTLKQSVTDVSEEPGTGLQW